MKSSLRRTFHQRKSWEFALSCIFSPQNKSLSLLKAPRVFLRSIASKITIQVEKFSPLCSLFTSKHRGTVAVMMACLLQVSHLRDLWKGLNVNRGRSWSKKGASLIRGFLQCFRTLHRVQTESSEPALTSQWHVFDLRVHVCWVKSAALTVHIHTLTDLLETDPENVSQMTNTKSASC